jgi:hypothetical protein
MLIENKKKELYEINEFIVKEREITWNLAHTKILAATHNFQNYASQFMFIHIFFLNPIRQWAKFHENKNDIKKLLVNISLKKHLQFKKVLYSISKQNQ